MKSLTVDFVITKAPACRIVAKTLVGRWPGEKALRAEFERLAAWAKRNGLKTGWWVFRELNRPDAPLRRRRWEVGVEIHGKRRIRGEKGLSVKSLPATTVVSVTFDPTKVSPRLVYHGLESFISWRRKSKEYTQSGPTREVYESNPWTSRRAWSRTHIQMPVRRLSG